MQRGGAKPASVSTASGCGCMRAAGPGVCRGEVQFVSSCRCSRCRLPLPPPLQVPPPDTPRPLPMQGAIGLQLVSSARIAEVYALQAGGDRSYVCSLRGTLATSEQQHEQRGGEPQPQQPQLWSIEHRWQPPQRVGALVLRLLSLAERDTLHLASLDQLPPSCSAAAPTAAEERAAALGGPAAAIPGAGPSAGLDDGASGGSQMDEIRGLLSQLVAGDGGNSSGSPSAAGPAAAPAADPKRSLMAAIARSVLQQAPPSASRQPAQAAGIAAAQQGQRPSRGRQPLEGQPQNQQDGQEEQQWQAPQGGEAEAALRRLEGRVAALEGLCREMHGMLRQLLAAQQPQQEAPA